MTVNMSCLIFVIFTSIILGHAPFNIVQLLWINLIMDVLAAIAFATENPHPTEIRKERISQKDRIITKTMMRSILTQGIYQLLVMIFLLFVGPKISNIEYNMFQTEMTNPDGTPSYRMLHQTFMFQCFIMMNLFNMINCRVLDPMPRELNVEESSIEEQAQAQKPEFNIFTRPFNNFWFWVVFFGELNVQFIMVGYPVFGKLFTTTPLTFGMHMTAVGLGLGSWAVAALTKLTGAKFVNAMPEFGEDEDALKKAQAHTNRASNALNFEGAGEGDTAGNEKLLEDED